MSIIIIVIRNIVIDNSYTNATIGIIIVSGLSVCRIMLRREVTCRCLM